MLLLLIIMVIFIYFFIIIIIIIYKDNDNNCNSYNIDINNIIINFINMVNARLLHLLLFILFYFSE